jgi:hypothetical protein
MKKFILALSIVFATGATTLKAQDFCGSLNSILSEAGAGFETLKGKYTTADYDGSWVANKKIAGASAAEIQENSGWYVATFYAGASEAAANKKWKELCAEVKGCVGTYTSWNFNNVGEHMQTMFFSENASEKLNADGGSYGGYGASRDYANWDAAPKGKTVEVEVRQRNGNQGYEVHIKVYNAN